MVCNVSCPLALLGLSLEVLCQPRVDTLFFINSSSFSFSFLNDP